MATVVLASVDKPISLVALLDPVTGAAIGTATAPQFTQDSLQATRDLTKSIASITTATTTTLITATASQFARVYRMRIDVAGAQVLTITDSTGAEEMNFTAAGFRIMDFSSRAWYMTAVNTALTAITTTTAKVTITTEFTKAP